jgi:beta-mannanase
MSLRSQLKFVVEDFEGLSDGTSDLKSNGIFTYGSVNASVEQNKNIKHTSPDYLGERHITIKKTSQKNFAGWGKGISLNIELDPLKDHLNFYAYQASENIPYIITIQLQEDDNDNKTYEKQSDDAWVCKLEVKPNASIPQWQLISIPLNTFKDSNTGGDGVFNCTYKTGKLLTIILTFENATKLKKDQTISFDFICFSQGELLPDPPPVISVTEHCSLGLWSEEGNQGRFTEIATGFETLFKDNSQKKLGVVHFFQPFAVDGGNTQNHYPSVERINNVIDEGYIPMITLENHFRVNDPSIKQPNLYSIVEGHFDSFFGYWASQIKQVKGIVLLRILHEFNGNWYPWCIINNDKNPELLVKAYRHIHTIFKENHVTNVKFIWCPNSMSVPQEKWNYIMDAYPGDEYVDFTGIDVYNGAGQTSPVWMSFRKVGIENYFLLTQKIANKPLLICETASRERESSESRSSQTKAEWIKQQSEALRSDMNKIKLLSWFNEKGTFKINSSPEAQNAFLNYILKDDHFKSGTKYLSPILTP